MRNRKLTRSLNEIVSFLNSGILHEVISLSWTSVSVGLTSLFVSRRRLAEFKGYENLLKQTSSPTFGCYGLLINDRISQIQTT